MMSFATSFILWLLCFGDSSMLWCVTVADSFVLLFSIPFYACTIFCLFILLLKNIWIILVFGSMRAHLLLWTYAYLLMYKCKSFSILAPFIYFIIFNFLCWKISKLQKDCMNKLICILIVIFAESFAKKL